MDLVGSPGAVDLMTPVKKKVRLPVLSGLDTNTERQFSPRVTKVLQVSESTAGIKKASFHWGNQKSDN